MARSVAESPEFVALTYFTMKSQYWFMTADYANLVQQELDWASKIDGIDESTLSPADDAYYLEVQGRVLKKLGETGVSLS